MNEVITFDENTIVTILGILLRANHSVRYNNRDNRQWRNDNDDNISQSNDNSRWRTAGSDVRHTERYTRNGNWRVDNY